MNRVVLALVVCISIAALVVALLMSGEEVKGREPNDPSAADAKIRAGSPDIAKTEAHDAARERESSKSGPESTPAAESQPSEGDLANAAMVFRGIVLDAHKKPIAGAEVLAVRTWNLGGQRSFKGASRDDGRFAIPIPDRAGWSWRVEASAPGYAVSHLTQVPSWLPEIDVGPILLYPAISVKGRVLDRDGHAIANAKIYVKVVPLPSEEMDTEDDGVGGDYKPLAISGPDGNYSISSLSPGKLTMGAQADGYADAVRPGITLARDKANEVDFNVAPEERLQGTVVDEHASPVAKARVVARRQNARAAFWRKGIESDSQGKFSVAGLDRSRRELSVQIHKAGYTTLWQDGSHLPADEKYTIRKSAVVSVKTERPGGGAGPAIRSVRFERRNNRNNRWSGWGDVPKFQREVVEPNNWQVTTDMRGQTRVVATAEDGSTGTSSEFEIPQNSSSVLDVSITIEKSGSVTGRVVGSDLQPLANVRLELTGDRNWGLLKVSTTQEAGIFTFDGVPPGTTTISIRSKEWVGESTKVDVRAGDKTEGIELVVRKPSKVSGRLTIGDAPPGEVVPISFYLVRTQDSDVSWQFLGITTADEKGDFQFSPAPAGRVALVPKRKVDPEDGSIRNFERENQHPEYDEQRKFSWPHVVDVPPEAEARIDVNIPAQRHSYIHGQVTVNNEARPGLDLWVYSNTGGNWYSETTNSEGKFKFRLDAAGEYQLQLWGDGFSENRTVSVGEGDDRELNLTLNSGAIEGMVADAAGQPLSLRVRLERQKDKNANNNDMSWGWWDAPEQMTKADGTFSFPEAVASGYRVIVDDPKKKFATMASAVFTIGSKERYAVPQIRVPLASPIVVNAKTPDGKPISGRMVVVAAPGSEALARKQQTTYVGRQGTARMNGVRPGPVVVKFVPNGPWTAADQTVSLPSNGSDTVLNFEVKKKEGAQPGEQPGANGPQILDGNFTFGEDGMNFDEVEWDFGNEIDGVQIHYGIGGSDDGGD